jgi:hypothetical protein
MKKLLVIACVLFAGCGSSGASTTPPPLITPTATDSGPSASPGADASAGAGQTAVVHFNDMMLDAANGPEAQPRTFEFISDGSGLVSVSLKSQSATDSTTFCVTVNFGAPTCDTKNSTGLQIQTPGNHATWQATAISADAKTPIVDITINWPTNSPHVTLTHGRLQGSMSPGVPEQLNGFNVTFKPRGAGSVTVASSWTVIVTDIDVALADASTLPWVNLDEQQYSGVQSVNYSHVVDPSKTYRVMLRDLDADNYRPDLTADITFP